MNLKVFLIIFASSLGLMVAGSIVGGMLQYLGIVTKENLGPQGIKIIIIIYLTLMIIFAYAAVLPFLRLFITLGTTLMPILGKMDRFRFMVSFIKNNERAIVYCVWLFFSVGLIISIPVAIKNWFPNPS